MAEKIKRYILISVGLVSLMLGTAGLVFPILPTTPFLLLSAYCFTRSSKRLLNWLTGNKIYGRFIRNYLVYGAISRRTKIIAIILLWITLGFSIFIVGIAYVKIIICAVGIGVTIHLMKLKELKNNTEPPAVMDRTTK